MKTRISFCFIMLFILFTPMYTFADYVGDSYISTANLSTDGYADFIVCNTTYDDIRWKVESPNNKTQYWNEVEYEHTFGYIQRIYFTGGIGTYRVTPQYLNDSVWYNFTIVYECYQPLMLSSYLYPAPFVESKGTRCWKSSYNIIPDAADTISNGSITDKEKAIKFYEWIHKNVTYDFDELVSICKGTFNENYTWNGAEYAYVWETGVCHDQVSLFIGLCRAKGIPAKGIYGKLINNERYNYHSWAEVYLDGAWVKFDPTNNKWGSQITSSEYEFISEDANMN